MGTNSPQYAREGYRFRYQVKRLSKLTLGNQRNITLDIDSSGAGGGAGRHSFLVYDVGRRYRL
jgi:hypothetical protein